MKTSNAFNKRQQIIMNAAVTCFIEKGFHATSMRDIARQAGVSLGNLYNHFSGKQQLIREVAAIEQAELTPIIEALNSLRQPDLTAFGGILRQLFLMCQQPDWAILTAECLAEFARSPELVPDFDENRQHLLSSISSAITRGIDSKQFSTPLSPPLLAQILIDGIEAEALRVAIFPSYDSECQLLANDALSALLGASCD